VDAELQRNIARNAVLQTARMAYSKALKEALPKETDDNSGLVINEALLDKNSNPEFSLYSGLSNK